jgi:hypothetical protein
MHGIQFQNTFGIWTWIQKNFRILYSAVFEAVTLLRMAYPTVLQVCIVIFSCCRVPVLESAMIKLKNLVDILGVCLLVPAGYVSQQEFIFVLFQDLIQSYTAYKDTKPLRTPAKL